MKGIHLGWRRANLAEPGVWYVKWEVASKLQGQTTERRQERMGFADDLQDGDDDTILDHAQAVEKALKLAKGEVPRAPKGDYSVGDVLDAYMAAKGKAEGRGLSQIRAWVNKTKGELGSLKVARLERKDVEDWFYALAKMAPRVRTKNGEAPKARSTFDPNNPEHLRARQSSANKSLRLFKAAMNLALADPMNLAVTADAAWKGISEFTNVEASRGEPLTPRQAADLINGCTPEFRPLAFGGLLTGMRYGELIRLQVRHFRPLQNCLVVDFDKRDKNRFAPLTEEGLAIFLAICKGRDPEEPMFLMADGKPWTRGKQTRPMKSSSALADVEACFYLLRHTCITRWAETGIPLHVISKAVGSSVKMIEEHYEHLTPEAIHKKLNDQVEKFGICEEDMAEARAELARLQASEGRGVLKHLSFRLNTLHPSEFAGKIRGGTTAPPKRPNPEELAVLVEEMSLPQIAERYEVNEAGVRKWCKKWGIATKPRGYWAKVYARASRMARQMGAVS